MASDRTGRNRWRRGIFQRPAKALDRAIALLSRTSYALFLVHYAVLLLANAAWAEIGSDHGDAALLFMAASWFVALGASYLGSSQKTENKAR
ncbi:MAG: hypothetical protein U5L73_10420 [Rhodoferax sp.]|nr:hypothetical protein [Rhodoferax sp.]